MLIPLNTYQGQFPEMRKKIDKRGRKLIDFDKERHNIQQLQTNPITRGQKKTLPKIPKIEFREKSMKVEPFSAYMTDHLVPFVKQSESQLPESSSIYFNAY